ncbi:MAG: hypothetical protein DSZ29_05270 [Aquificaceae bacterium]|nr:MAG: hypothetical protein DSZ29_05270 [Aquificaceae bacterium]
MSTLPSPSIQGCGIGLRSQHFATIEAQKPAVPWFEILSDNYLIEGTVQREFAQQIRPDYPITFHGVGLSIGSVEPLNKEYLKRLLKLKKELEPAWVSDHLCWTSAHGYNTHDLIPLPYTEHVADHIAERILQVQDALGERLVIENVSSYLQFKDTDMSEWDFINLVIEKSDCNLLLDVNNIYVSAINHQFNAEDYLLAMPADKVKEIHLAGYEDKDTHLLDTHSRPVTKPVWDLFAKAVQHIGDVPVLIEWDNDIPEFSRLMQEADTAKKIQQEQLSKLVNT